MTIANAGKEPVEKVEIFLESKIQPGMSANRFVFCLFCNFGVMCDSSEHWCPLDLLNKVFIWNKENLESQLPLQPGAQACFTVYIHGASDYLPLSQSGKY